MKAESIVLLDGSGGGEVEVEVDVMWPGAGGMERVMLGEVLGRGGSGGRGGCRRGERERDGGEGQGEGQGKGFSVLCFLGYTIEHLGHLRYAML